MQASGAEWPTGMVGHGDTISGTVLAGGICAALLQRERTGVVSVVDGSLLGTAIWYNHQPIVGSKLGVQWGGPPTPRETRVPALNSYRTSDGRFISLVFVNDPDGDWVDLCEHLGHPEMAEDPRFSTSSARSTHRAEAVSSLDQIFAQRTLDEWKQTLATIHGAWAPVQTAADIHDDPQTIANGFVRTVQYPVGPISLPVPPVLFDEEGGDVGRAPDYCEHTDEVLSEAGFTAEEMAHFRATRVIA
jgi:crotonobetainyl-CoA:carnitine CoA-transferase CaiB-like acyl-CoA transferase